MAQTDNFETAIIGVPFETPDPHGALSMPIYSNVAFDFASAEEMELAFKGRSAGHAYSRITNPTVSYFERRIQTLKKALSVSAFNTGMSAIAGTLISLARSGGNIVTSSHLFGNTVDLLLDTLGPFGVEVRFVDLTDLDAAKQAVDEKTCAVFLEIITNPQLEVADLQGLGQICSEAGVPLVADTTVVAFSEFDAKSLGVNIELFSSTKWLSAGGTSLGGVIIDYGTAKWKKHYRLAEVAKKYGAFAFTQTLRGHVSRNLGIIMTPQVANLHTLGLETLRLRFRHQSTTALNLARRLEESGIVQSVNYPALESSRFKALSDKQFGPLPGAVLTFDLADRSQCFSVLNRLKLIHRATNLFDNRSLAIHPASTIFGTFSAEDLQKMDVSEKTIRLSVGLEDVDSLFNDIRQAIDA